MKRIPVLKKKGNLIMYLYTNSAVSLNRGLTSTYMNILETSSDLKSRGENGFDCNSAFSNQSRHSDYCWMLVKEVYAEFLSVSDWL